MSPAQNPQAVREALERVLSSFCFARCERVSKLLRFLVERRLDGRESELKESIIGVDVFGRKPDYDPKVDSTVRTEAVRLRARLSRYYATEGSRDPLVIELPKGGYVPSFRPLETIPAAPQSARRMPWLAVGLAVFAVTAAVAGGWWILNRNAPIRIGVLPLVDTSQDAANDYLADGLTSEIINDLSIIQGLAVRSQTSSFSLKGKRPSAREAGSHLNADYILEGSILRSGQRLRINTELVRARDDVPIWSGRFELELTDMVSVQDEISRGIVNSLRLKLGQGRRRYEANAEAYDLYLQARASEMRVFPGDPEVIGRFEKVIAKDPSFAPAYAGLAAAHAWRSGVGVAAPEQADSLRKMRDAAERAIQLDPLLAEAHCALGVAYARNGEWRQAEQSFRRAIEIGPNLSSAHGLFARFVLWPLNRIAECVREMRTAESNDPLSPDAHEELASVLLSAGRFDEAAHQCELIPADTLYRNECLGRTWLCQGRTADAIRALSNSPTNNWGYLANAYAKAGRRAEAEKLMTEAPALYPDRRGAFQFALAFAGFGDKDRTLERLERLARVGPVRIGYTLNSPEFAFLRGDPRTKALRKRMGLPE
ncbi:MAG TPA: tetratricopeptide repeat protein [Bryobacteraceae bacterium]|nr:tetratricopeptide repeat protein [Bryobacteraceae bacterium]